MQWPSTPQAQLAGQVLATVGSQVYEHSLTSPAAPQVPPGLYLVATPIGNLGDVTLRALETLAAVEAIACEDSRVTRRLLERYAMTTPLLIYHDHNAEIARPKILARLAAGAAIALVSDAGTPLISDPGFSSQLLIEQLWLRVEIPYSLA